MSDVPCFIGIDVAKAQWDIALRPSGERWAVPNEASGVTTRVDQLPGPPPHPHCAGSHGRPGAPGAQRLGHGGPARGRRAPAPGPGCCPGHGPAGHNGRLGCAGAGALCRRDAPDTPAAAGRPDAGAAGPPGAPPATDHHADRGSRTAWRGPARAWPGHEAHMAWLNARLATLDDDLETRAPGQPAVASTRRPVAECPGHWPGVCAALAPGTPRVGDAHAAADGGPGRGGHTALAVKKAVTTIPVVFSAGDPLGMGLVARLDRPGENVTGVSVFSGELNAKRLELLKAAVPAVSGVAVLANPANPSTGAALKELEGAAQALRVTLHVLEVREYQEIDDAFAAMARERVEALLVVTDPMFFAAARAHRRPGGAAPLAGDL